MHLVTTGNVQMNGSRGDRSVQRAPAQLPVKGPFVQQQKGDFVQQRVSSVQEWVEAGAVGSYNATWLLVLISAVAARCLVIKTGDEERQAKG